MSAYATADELKAWLDLPASDTADDALFELAIDAASKQIDARCNTTFDPDDIPPGVHVAALIQSSRLFHRKDSPYGIAGSPAEGSELRLLARLDPDVDALLSPYRVAVIVGDLEAEA